MNLSSYKNKNSNSFYNGNIFTGMTTSFDWNAPRKLYYMHDVAMSQGIFHHRDAV